MTIRVLSGGFADVVDLVDGGGFKVVGTTKRVSSPLGTPDVPVSRQVRLHDQLTGRLIRVKWSDATTGNYIFDRIRAGVFYVVALDHTGLHNGVIATNVASEPM